MPRSVQQILQHADALADRFEQADGPADDFATAKAAILRAFLAKADAERQLMSTIALARGEGMSWSAIGELLGISGEAARKQHAQHLRTH